MSFHRDLVKYRKKFGEKYLDILRGASFDLFSAIILSTPVDKGTLRANWFVSLGVDTMETTNAKDTTGSTTIKRAEVRLNPVSFTDTIFFVNNMPYAERIEFDGYSAKADLGMVRINTIRWNSIVKRVAKKVEGGI